MGAVVVSHDREFLSRCVTTVVELDLAQQRVEVFGGGYEAYLAEREVRRRHAREAFEEYADTKADLTTRMRSQRAWAVQGVTKEKKNPKDGDKAQRDFRINRTEKQASKVRATEKLIERLDVVEEPRKEWQLQMEIAAAPRSGSVVVHPQPGRRAPRRVHPRAGRPDPRVRRPGRRRRPERGRQDHAHRPAARPYDAGRGFRLAGRVGARGRDRPGPRPRRRARPAHRRGRARPPGLDARRRPDAARQVRAAGRPRGPRGRFAVPRRTHPRRARPAAGPRHQPARPRRADQPPRPARHRAARERARLVRRDARPGQPRPPAPRGRARDPAPARRRAVASRNVPSEARACGCAQGPGARFDP